MPLFLCAFEDLRRKEFRVCEATDHVVVFEDPFHQVGQCAHQAVAPAGLGPLLVGSRGDPDVDGFLRAATVPDLDFPDARIL